MYNKPPLIMHVIHHLVTGGMENGLVNIINRIPENKFRHVIVCIEDSNNFRHRIKRKDVKIYAMKKQKGKDFGLYLRLYRVIKQLKPDIIHTRNIAALEAQFIAFLCGIKARIHGLHGWDSDQAKQNKLYLRLYKILDSLIHRYIPLSDELALYLTKDVGVTDGKITKICNGVDTKLFTPVQVARKSILPEGFNEPSLTVIGTVGRMERVKDQLNLVEAFTYLLRKYPDLILKTRMVLVGSGSMENEIREKVALAGIEEFVWMPGVREDIPTLMQAMDIFVLPSQAEGISNTILEAMASALPVIATDVGGNKQLVVEDETGYIVPSKSPEVLAEALVTYLKNPAKKISHASASRERALCHFSIEHMVNAYQDVYESFSINCSKPLN